MFPKSCFSRTITFSSTLFRHNKAPEEIEGLEDKCEATVTMENGIPCDSLDLKAGRINGVYAAADDERFTSL